VPYQTIEKEWREEWVTSKNGKYLKIDSGSPDKRALQLYGPLMKHETYLFTQLKGIGNAEEPESQGANEEERSKSL
jgi:hypothetical protein